MLGMRQQELADALNIAQQQLQKYETGKTELALLGCTKQQLLKAPIAWFYEGLDDPAAEENLQMVLGLADGETHHDPQTRDRGLAKGLCEWPRGATKTLADFEGARQFA